MVNNFYKRKKEEAASSMTGVMNLLHANNIYITKALYKNFFYQSIGR